MKTALSETAGGTILNGRSLAQLADILRFAVVLGAGDRPNRNLFPDAGQEGSPHPEGSQPDFGAAVLELFRLLQERNVRYLLVGGVALLRYVPGRNTEDIDLILALEDLSELPEITLEERNEWFAKGKFRGIRVDLLFTANPLFRRVLERYATIHHFLERDVPVVTAEGLLLLKLYALPSLYRQGDLQKANLYEGDIAAVLLARQPDVEPIFRELDRHVSPTDLGELRKIVAEAKARQARFGENRPPS